MRKQHASSWLIVCLSLGVMLPGLVGCGGGDGRVATPEAWVAGDGLPALADLPAPPRSASGSYHLSGNDALMFTSGEVPTDPFVMTAPAGDYRFAIYGFYPANSDSFPRTLVLNLDGSAGTVWLGLGNYATGVWDWQPIEAPFSTWMEISVPFSGDQYRYYSAGEVCYFALVVHDSAKLSFAGAILETQNHWIISPGSWEGNLIAAGVGVGKHHAACLLADGTPAVVYTDDNLQRIRFATTDSLQPYGDWDVWTTHVVDSGENRGGKLDLCLSSGVPAVVYEDTNLQDVYYAASTAAKPAQQSDWASHQPYANAQAQPRLANLNGRDYVLFRSLGGQLDLAQAQVEHPAGGIDWGIMTVDSGASSYDYLQLAMDTAGPVLAYKRLEGGPAYLYYAWSDALDGGDLLTFNKVLVDETNTNNGNNIQLVLGEDRRAWIAYTNVDIVHYMRFASANTITPAGAGQFTRCDVFRQEQTHTGQYMGLGRFENRPLFSFIETGSGAVEGIHALYPNRDLTYNTTEAFDHALLYEPAASEMVNEETEVLTLSNGRPAIIFRTNEGLHFYCAPIIPVP